MDEVFAPDLEWLLDTGELDFRAIDVLWYGPLSLVYRFRKSRPAWQMSLVLYESDSILVHRRKPVVVGYHDSSGTPHTLLVSIKPNLISKFDKHLSGVALPALVRLSTGMRIPNLGDVKLRHIRSVEPSTSQYPEFTPPVIPTRLDIVTKEIAVRSDLESKTGS